MTYLAIIRRTLAYAVIGAAFYYLIPAWRFHSLGVDVLIIVFGSWLLDMAICLISRVRQ